MLYTQSMLILTTMGRRFIPLKEMMPMTVLVWSGWSQQILNRIVRVSWKWVGLYHSLPFSAPFTV